MNCFGVRGLWQASLVTCISFLFGSFASLDENGGNKNYVMLR